ncbi:DUF4179 domain-containing protein [Paenibacillus sp. RC67]|uniref:DUF4179 domain-containing protein n=1 Tax=Paenibacillus sp. RC67 TaxID=3039392 RepID=UPI0024ACECC5|nr:DUF4179 domain-containing protein [Paenibacillus sp. RC67]
MNSSLDDKLKEAQDMLPDPMPPIVRSKLDETYEMIKQMELPVRGKQEPVRNKMSLLKKAGLSAAAAAVLGTVTIGSGFVSPVMAEALKQIPILSSIFNLWGQNNGDPGIQQADNYFTNVNKSVTQGGLTMNISTSVFDGTRVVMELNTPGNRLYVDPTAVDSPSTKGSVEKIEALYKGQLLAVDYGTLDMESSNHLLMEVSGTLLEQSPDDSSALKRVSFPKRFDLTMNVKLKGYEKPFQLVVPVIQTTQNTVLTSKETKSFDNINLKINKLEMTPLTTQLDISYTTKPGQNINDMLASVPAKYKHESGSFIALHYDVVDDQGVYLKPLGGSAFRVESMLLRFEPFKTMPKSVTIKPYLMLSDGEAPAGAVGRVELTNISKEYIPELEFTLPVK